MFYKPITLKFFIAIMGLFSIFSLFTRCKPKSNYYISNGQWYFKEALVKGAEINSFTALNDVFAVDQSSGYYRGEEIENSDGSTFIALDNYYAKDTNQVYYCETYRKGQEYYLYTHNTILRLPSAATDSFCSVGEGYAKDNQSVYFKGKSFEVADPIHFKLLGLDFAKDGIQGYYACKKIKGSSASSFTVISEHYAKDDSSVWYVERDYTDQSVYISRLNIADPGSFAVQALGYSKDEKHIFYRDSLMRRADVKSFQPVEGKAYDAQDSRNDYLEGKKIGRNKN
ncbi:DKNYY domain-containing protein [Pedobacter boryungensis]|uniref:DKNYY domain-containing protein n=1 Tax=Pedobacter boryungensis TaxID=869962 RepID=A0ABX2DGU1_9SPHI|nr:DKNYY domain-containing protein [Pedobacter boryungensis]NQX33165.1 DKNYY domain-containing protein [Pedobacter boryungensis]